METPHTTTDHVQFELLNRLKEELNDLRFNEQGQLLRYQKPIREQIRRALNPLEGAVNTEVIKHGNIDHLDVTVPDERVIVQEMINLFPLGSPLRELRVIDTSIEQPVKKDDQVVTERLPRRRIIGPQVNLET